MSQQISQYNKDVYISYSEADQDWVDRELIRRLNAANISYVESRTFRLGQPYINEIENAVTKSRHTLLVISANYLEDTWEGFAGNLAFGHVLTTGNWRVIPAIKEECELPTRLGALVSVNLYSNQEDEWNRLTSSLIDDSAAAKEITPQHEKKKEERKEEHGARDGLVVLLELVNRPEVRSHLSAFKADFQALREQIKTLDSYKKIHDLFQQLEGQYNMVYHLSKNSEARLVDWDGIENILPDIEDVIDALAKRVPDNNLWVQQLHRIFNDLLLAPVGRDVGKLKSAIRRLSEVLRTIPSRFNASMVETAKNLRLIPLEKVLATVHEKLTNLDRDMVTKGQLELIKKSIGQIDEMDRNLRTILYLHDSLQWIDDELRRIETTLDEGIGQIIDAWTDLQQSLQLVCTGNNSDWATKLSAAGDKLKTALKLDKDEAELGGEQVKPDDEQAKQDEEQTKLDEDGIKRSFRAYRSQASRSFNQVDQEMLSLCKKLEDEIGEPLAPLLVTL